MVNVRGMSVSVSVIIMKKLECPCPYDFFWRVSVSMSVIGHDFFYVSVSVRFFKENVRVR